MLDTSDYWISMENAVEECFTFQENLSGIGEDLDPCLAYHDEEQRICALCKINSARIAFTLDNGLSYFVCGSVRLPLSDQTGVYTFLDPDNFEWDDLASEMY